MDLGKRVGPKVTPVRRWCFGVGRHKLRHMRKDCWKHKKDKDKGINDKDDHNTNMTQDEL